MKIVSIKKVEDCFDGSTIFGYEFDQAWSHEAIMQLETLGTVEYFAQFPKPFFRAIGREGLIVKGVEGEPTCRAIYPRRNKEATKAEFERIFE